MHIEEKSSWIKHLDFIIINLISEILAFMIAYFIKFGDLGFIYSNAWRSVLLIMCLINLIVTFVMNPYSGIFRRPNYEDAIKMGLFVLYSFILVSLFFYVMKVGAVFSRITIVLTFVIYYILVVILVYIRKRMLLSGKVKGFTNRKRKLFVIADYKNIEETKENILSSDIEEYDIVGYCFTDGLFQENEYDGCEVVNIEWVADYVITEHIDDVFISADPVVLSSISYKKFIDNEVTVHLNLEAMTGTEGDDQFISSVGVYKTASIGPYAFDGKRMLYLAVKRVCDLLFGIIGCVLLLPLIAVVKISYLVSGDRASIFYFQTRVGQYGKHFKLYKFRSMVYNADEVLVELLKQEQYKRQWEANQKLDKDPRITKIGRFLRKTSLDEFPQFLNLIKGDMSLVGPRPLVVGELTDHDGLTLYNRVKPGITGWWACNGRSNINYRERLELEYYYVKNCSFYLDALCIIRSILAVVKRDGAQ